jgi:hypothetical protein
MRREQHAARHAEEQAEHHADHERDTAPDTKPRANGPDKQRRFSQTRGTPATAARPMMLHTTGSVITVPIPMSSRAIDRAGHDDPRTLR